MAGVGADVRAVLADVGVLAGALGLGAQAVAPGQPCLDRGGLLPVPVEQRQGGAACRGRGGGQRADLLLGEGERAFVSGADGLVEQPPVAQAHLGGDVFYMR